MKQHILVITSYPQQGTIHGEGTVGIASYTKNTLLHLQKVNPEIQFTILAEVLDQNESYEEDSMHIHRVWKRNNFGSLIHLGSQMMTRTYSQIIIPFEVYMFGTAFYAGMFLFILSVLKLLGKKITLIIHQVPETIDDVEKGSLRAVLFPVFKHVLYGLITFSASHVVVFENTFKQRLGNKSHIVVIPHAVEPVKILAQPEAKMKLGLDPKTQLVLYFGFLSPYKGIDQLISAWDTQGHHKLILAGGGNPNHMDDPKYEKYIEQLTHAAEKKDITITGFVSEKELPFYFSAADLVILPYLTFFSSSGPLSLAFAYEKPVLLSPPFQGYFETEDFQQAAKSSGIGQTDLISPITINSLPKYIGTILKNKTDFEQFSRTMKEARSWDRIAHQYSELIVSSKESKS